MFSNCSMVILINGFNRAIFCMVDDLFLHFLDPYDWLRINRLIRNFTFIYPTTFLKEHRRPCASQGATRTDDADEKNIVSRFYCYKSSLLLYIPKTHYVSHMTTLQKAIYFSYLELTFHALLRQGLVYHWPLIHACVSLPWNLGQQDKEHFSCLGISFTWWLDKD